MMPWAAKNARARWVNRSRCGRSHPRVLRCRPVGRSRPRRSVGRCSGVVARVFCRGRRAWPAGCRGRARASRRFGDLADLLHVEVEHVAGPADDDRACCAVGLAGGVEESTAVQAQGVPRAGRGRPDRRRPPRLDAAQPRRAPGETGAEASRWRPRRTPLPGTDDGTGRFTARWPPCAASSTAGRSVGTVVDPP